MLCHLSQKALYAYVPIKDVIAFKLCREGVGRVNRKSSIPKKRRKFSAGQNGLIWARVQ